VKAWVVDSNLFSICGSKNVDNERKNCDSVAAKAGVFQKFVIRAIEAPYFHCGNWELFAEEQLV
jgi:hypothetical protein